MDHTSEERTSETVYINHYNIRSREQFKRKMILGAEACERNIKLGKQAAQHWRYFLERYHKGVDMDQEFDRAVGNYCLWEIHKYKLCDIDNTVRDFFRSNPVQ